jgi:hypothetical protein
VLAGAGVKAGHYPDTQMVDLAPTMAALLGTSIPSLSQGHVRTDMLQLTDEQRAHITELERQQQEQWVYSYLIATGQPSLQLGATGDPVDDAQGAVEASRAAQFAWAGLGRTALVALIMLAIVVALWFLRDPIEHWELLAALVYLVVFHATYALIEGRTYSMSSVLSANDIILTCILTAGVAVAAGVALVLWRANVLQRGWSFTANTVLRTALVIIAIVALPALIGYAVNGTVISWRLPNFPLMFMTFISLLQLAGIGLFGIALAGLAALGSRFVMPRS